MALHYVRSQFGLRPTSSKVTVPENNLARLMYYLNCVFHSIEYDDQDMRRYRDFHNWSFLTEAEQRMVFILALALSPDEFDNRVFFHSDELCGDSTNKFYELSEVRHQLLAVQSILVAGQTRQVKKIMTYRRSWMKKFYYEPIQVLSLYYKQQRERQRQQVTNRPATARPRQSTSTNKNQPSQGCVIL